MPLSAKISETISGVTVEYALSISDEALMRDFGVVIAPSEIDYIPSELRDELEKAIHQEARLVLDQARPALHLRLSSAMVSFYSLMSDHLDKYAKCEMNIKNDNDLDKHFKFAVVSDDSEFVEIRYFQNKTEIIINKIDIPILIGALKTFHQE